MNPMRRWHASRRQPPWWPTNEPWPPTAPPWRAMRGHFFRRMGWLMAFFFLFVFGAFALIGWLVASALGIIEIPRGALLWACPLGLLALAFGMGSVGALGRTL